MRNRLLLACPSIALGLCAACYTPQANTQGDRAARDDPAYVEAMAKVCNVDALARLDPEENPISIDADRFGWLMDHVGHPDVIELVTLLRVHADAQRATMLAEALTGTPHQACELQRHYEQNAEAQPGPKPRAAAPGSTAGL